jgi:hypothetical protein
VDRQIRRMASAAEDAPRPYRIVVLSDHGQSQGATFLDRYGLTLEDLVREAAGASTVAAHGHPDEAVGYLGASLTEASGGDSAGARAVRTVTRSRRVEGTVELGRQNSAAVETSEQPPELIVMASGCLGLISLPREPGRVTLERLEERHPRLIPTLRDHPGIGFVLVRSERHGAMAIGPLGINYLDEERVDGEDPLAPFGPNAARHVRRTDRFPHCPDIVVNSTYWKDTDEVAAFEELVGSHGGMGGPQSFPFLLHPADLELSEEQLVGAEAVHRQLRRWLVQLGHRQYAEEAVQPGL